MLTRMRTWLSGLGVLVLCPGLLAEPGGDLHHDFAQMHRKIEATMASRDVPGCAIGVVVGDRLAHGKAFGYADLQAKRPVDANTIFQIGSLTKTMTTTLMSVLRDDGYLDLHDPVSKFLPEGVGFADGLFDPAGLTLFHLATHTSGLPGNPPNRRNLPDSPSVMLAYSVKELYQGIPRTALNAQPGEQVAYSNYGMFLLGHTLERAAGLTYEKLLDERIFKPLGMTSTMITPTPEQEARFANHHWSRDNPRVKRPRWVFGQVSGAGGVASTVGDLARYMSLQFRTDATFAGPVKPSTLREMHTPQRIMDSGRFMYMGLGWFVRNDPLMGRVIGHGGEVDGHSSCFFFSPDHGVGAIVLANVGQDTAEVILRDILPLVIAPARQEYDDFEYAKTTRDRTKVIDLGEKILKRAPGNAEVAYHTAYALLTSGRHKRAAQLYVGTARQGHRTAISAYNAACAFALGGMKDDALTWLARSRDCGYRGFRDRAQVESDTDLQSLHADPRWAALFAD